MAFKLVCTVIYTNGLLFFQTKQCIYIYIYIRVGVLIIRPQIQQKYHTHTNTVNDQLKGLFKEFTLKRRKEPLVCISVYSFSRNMCLLTSWLDLFCIFAETRIQGKKVSLLLAKLGDNNKKVHRFFQKTRQVSIFDRHKNDHF